MREVNKPVADYPVQSVYNNRRQHYPERREEENRPPDEKRHGRARRLPGAEVKVRRIRMHQHQSIRMELVF